MTDPLLAVLLLAAVGALAFWAGTRRHRSGTTVPAEHNRTRSPRIRERLRPRRGPRPPHSSVRWPIAVAAALLLIGIVAAMSWLVPGPGVIPPGLFGPVSGPGGLLGRILP